MPRLAVVQMESAPLDDNLNLDRVEAKIEEAAKQGADLAVFPECVLTGYVLSAEEAELMAEPIPGPRTARLAETCSRTGLTVLVGTLEKDTLGTCFNSAVLVGPEGVMATYRKSHLPLLGVDRFIAAGDVMGGPVETSIGRVGLLICYDIRFPEPARVLALGGAQVILLSTAWPDLATLYPDFMVQSRAAENSVYVAAADRVGVERGRRFLGRSLIVAPDGEKLAEAGDSEEEILVVDVDPSRSDQKDKITIPGEYEIHIFEDRRPELYQELAKSRADYA